MNRGCRSTDDKRYYMSKDEKSMIFELYKAHFTSIEISKMLPFSYQVIQILFRGFKASGIKQYDRIDLITKENFHAEVREQSEAHNSQQN
jgi:hypothetical protein